MRELVLLVIFLAANAGAVAPEPTGPLPTPQQLAWQRLEYGMFCHFGINTFYGQEWGNGTEDPGRFNPRGFDAAQWAETARKAGMGYLVFTAKHHDGFCLFPSEYTDHDVAASPWRGGQGDVVRDVADAARAAGLMFGFYLSPWDRHEPAYADSAQYDVYFQNQLRELLTSYGPVGEVWFDGAGSAGHVYDWDSYYRLIHELQPDALIAICGPDIRWVGNEEGVAPYTLWNSVPRGDSMAWHPAECDVPLREAQWFWHAESERRVKSLAQLLDIYYRSVGHGAVLLLNVSPDDRGLLPEADVARLMELREVLVSTFAANLASGAKAAASSSFAGGEHGAEQTLDASYDTYWAADPADASPALTLELAAPSRVNRLLLQEYLPLGQRVQAFTVEAKTAAGWQPVCGGTTVGYKRLLRFAEIEAAAIRIRFLRARGCPVINAVGLYCATREPDPPRGK